MAENTAFSIISESAREIVRIQSIDTDHFLIQVMFDTGESKTLDFSALVDSLKDEPWLGQLANPPFFAQVKLDNGALSWPDDLEFCAESLYNEPIRPARQID